MKLSTNRRKRLIKFLTTNNSSKLRILGGGITALFYPNILAYNIVTIKQSTRNLMQS